MFKKAWEWFTSGWWGSVTGSVIATIIFTKLWDSISPESFAKFVSAVVRFLKHPVPIWWTLVFIAGGLLTYYLIRRRKRKKKVEADDVWKKTIGNFTFGDLCDILMEKFISPSRVPGSSVDNALVIFYHYAGEFSKGIGPTTINDEGFAYKELAPYLAMHQLVDRRADTYYHLNDNGHLLYSSLAIAFKNYPQLKNDVYANQSTFTSLPPDVVYTKEQVNSFIGGFPGLEDIQLPTPASVQASGPVVMMSSAPAPAPAPAQDSNQ